jgi:hypothetical protein
LNESVPLKKNLKILGVFTGQFQQKNEEHFTFTQFRSVTNSFSIFFRAVKNHEANHNETLFLFLKTQYAGLEANHEAVRRLLRSEVALLVAAEIGIDGGVGEESKLKKR